MAEEIFTVWVSKYALSDGIKPCKVLLVASGKYYNPVDADQPYYGLLSMTDAFRTEPEAVADAEFRRGRKIASLQKSIDKIRKLTFAAKES